MALWAWTQALAVAGHEVVVLHAGARLRPDPFERFAWMSRNSAVTVRDIPHHGHRRQTLRPVRLERHLERGDLLVLHEGWVLSNLAAARAARRAGVPYVVIPHGVYDPLWLKYLKPPRTLRYELERKFLEQALAIHVFFPSEIQGVTALAPRTSFITVPTGHTASGERWRGGGGYLSWIGRVDPIHKGLDVLVRAVASIPGAERPVIRIHGYDYKGGYHELRGRSPRDGQAFHPLFPPQPPGRRRPRPGAGRRRGRRSGRGWGRRRCRARRRPGRRRSRQRPPAGRGSGRRTPR